MTSEHDRLILDHYRTQADKHGASASSTMEDEVVRAKEMELLHGFFSALARRGGVSRVLDLGCGNGHTVAELAWAHRRWRFSAVDFSLDMLAVAGARRGGAAAYTRADARSLPFADASFEAVYSERCLINILDWPGQQRALGEVARVLSPGGHYLMIECFTDGLEANNRARRECGLDEIEPAHHNRYLEKDPFRETVRPWFDPVEPGELDPRGGERLASNFLSSHYFIARVLHPLVTRGPWVRNTEFVKFFSFLPPVGNYSPIQALILRRKG